MKNKLLVGLVVFGIIAIFFFVVIQLLITLSSNASSQEDSMDYNTCLTTKNIVLYINTDNPAKVLSNIKVSSYLSHIKVKNCFNAKTECDSKGITTTPSWIIDGNKIDRDINLDDLEKYSGCKKNIPE